MAGANKIRRLFYDIETSPNIGLFWSSSYKTSISHDQIVKERAVICICYKWEGQKTVHNLKWDSNQCDRAMLLKFKTILEQAVQVVAHNGDNFDEKWLRTRYLYHDIPIQYKFNSIDTLKKARAHFKFNSNRLDYIGKFLFQEGKSSTNYDMWKQITLTNNRKALGEMVRYCKRDVELLEKVYQKLAPYIRHDQHVGVALGTEKYDCPKCGSSNTKRHGTYHTATGVAKHRMLCRSCNSTYLISNRALIERFEDKMRAKLRQ